MSSEERLFYWPGTIFASAARCARVDAHLTRSVVTSTRVRLWRILRYLSVKRAGELVDDEALLAIPSRAVGRATDHVADDGGSSHVENSRDQQQSLERRLPEPQRKAEHRKQCAQDVWRRDRVHATERLGESEDADGGNQGQE